MQTPMQRPWPGLDLNREPWEQPPPPPAAPNLVELAAVAVAVAAATGFVFHHRDGRVHNHKPGCTCPQCTKRHRVLAATAAR